MPKESLSVYMTAVDKMSPVLASITDKTKALDKANEELQQTYTALQKANQVLNAQRTELKTSLEVQKNRVSELRAEYKKYGDDVHSLKLGRAIEEQDSLKDKLKEVEDQLKANRKAFNENRETIRKGLVEDSGSTGGQGSGMGGLSSLGTIVAGLGVWNQVSSLAQSGVGAALKSTFGSDVGGIASGAFSSLMSGAALGTTIAPGLGTAVGAALGGIVGAIGGGIEQWANQSDAFRDYYGGLYDDVKDHSGEMVEGGSSIASGRQTDRISFKTLLGDRQTADTYLEKLVGMANSTPFLYDDLVAMSKTLATYGYSAKQDMGKAVAGERDDNYILDVLQTIGDTGAALGMGTSDMTAVAQALGRMKSSDKATREYLDILNDRGIGAVGYLADAYGVSQKDIYEKISGGEISGTEAVEIITAALREAYSGSMLEQSQTFAGISSTLEGLEQELENAGGDAYNTLRQSGKSAMVDAYGGELGDAIKEINAIMGENQARRENLQDQYMREVLDAVLNGNRGALWDDLDEKQQADLSAMHEDYISALERYQNGDTDAGAELESLYEQAQLLGQAYFDNSDEVARLNDIEEQEIAAIREATAGLDEATQASYRLSQELSKGLPVRLLDASSFSSREEYAKRGRDGLPGSGGLASPRQSYQSRGHAFGLERVPYDDYPALLHEGERVLTAAQARAQDAGQAGAPIQISITGNNFTGTPEEMADQLAEVIIRKVSQMNIAAAPK